MSALAHVAAAEPSGAADAGNGDDPAYTRRSSIAWLLLLPGLLWLLVFFIAPLWQLFTVSLQSDYPGYPGYYYSDVNVMNYVHAVWEYKVPFLRAFLYAAIATLLAFALAYPLAYAIAFKSGRWRNLMLIAVIAPFFTSFILRTFAWKQILADDGWLAGALNAIPLLPDVQLNDTVLAVILGLTYNYLPFMVLPIYASLERVDPRVIEAGGDLYANGFTTFRSVTLPMSLPGVFAGTLLTFIPAAGDFVNQELLGPQSKPMVGNVIQNQFLNQIGGYPTAAALSFVLMAIIVVMVFAYSRKFSTEDLV